MYAAPDAALQLRGYASRLVRRRAAVICSIQYITYNIIGAYIGVYICISAHLYIYMYI